jgi:hypothetical protein
MARKRKVYDDDDGRTIADMNVEGMPWYDRDRRDRTETGERKPPMDRTQRQATVTAVVLAALLIALVFGVGYFVVIFLMDSLWR